RRQHRRAPWRHSLNSTVKTALLWVVIIVLVFLLWSLFQTTKGTSEKIPFSTFIDRVNANQVEKVTISGDSIRGESRATAPRGRREFEVTGPPGPYPAMYDMLKAKGVTMELDRKSVV